MTLDQLCYFIEVYRLKSITAASENLFITRQALSTSIRKLEEEFNVTLFYRIHDGIQPTKAADAFYIQAIAIIKNCMRLNLQMREFTNDFSETSNLTIGIQHSIVGTLGEKIYAYLSNNFPNITFDVQVSDISLNYRDFNVSILSYYQERKNSPIQNIDDEYTVAHIISHPVYVWISASSSLASEELIDIKSLSHTPFCVLNSQMSGEKTLKYLAENYNYICPNKQISIDLISNFVRRIEKENYFTIDFNLGGAFQYESFFKDKNVLLKPTTLHVNHDVIYHKKLGKEFYPFIMDCFI